VKHKRYRPPISHIWSYRWRLYKPEEGRDYWICKLCHTAPNKPSKPTNFAYICTRSTSSAIKHLRLRHRLGPHGAITKEQSQPSTPSYGQLSINGYCAAAAERNASALAFDAGVFRGLLTRMFTKEQLPLSKVKAPAIRNVLIYLNPRCKVVIPSRTALRAGIAAAYDNALTAVASELDSASTKVNISFDLWTSLGRRLSLLGVVAYYLNNNFELHAILLAMPRMQGSHTAANLKAQISGIVRHFGLETTLGYTITDNASENRAYLNLLADKLAFDAGKRYVLYIEHVINLVAHKVLFGSDVESFEHKLEHTVTAEAVKLAT
jgi:hypothetical protein